MTEPVTKNLTPHPINVQISPEVGRGEYVNMTFVTHTGAEFVVDFVQYMPNLDPALGRVRIIMAPVCIKAFNAALTQNIQKYEERFGHIEIIENPLLGGPQPPGQVN